jgi:hypothetical protein
MATLTVEDVTPSLEAVASYISNRTVNHQNTVVGTFNDDTVPTGDEATIVAARAARYVALRLGSVKTTWTDELTETAVDVAALYAALQIETGYFADGSGDESGIVQQLGRMFREQIAALVAAARNNQPGAWRMHSIPIIGANSPAAYAGGSVVGDHLEEEQLVNGPDPDQDP